MDLWALQVVTLLWTALYWLVWVVIGVGALISVVRLVRVGRQTRALYRLEDYL